MKFTIITIFKFSSIKYNIFILLYKHHHHSPPELFSPCKTETLSPLNNSLVPLPSAPDTHHPFCLDESDHSRCLMLSGIMQYLSFCDWLSSLSIMSSRFIHIVECVKTSFLFKANVLFCLSIHPSMNTWVASIFCLLQKKMLL